jgi:hypothetical protein
MEQAPDILAPGHGVPFRVTQQDFETLRKRMQNQKEILSELVGGEHPNFGLDPSWIRLSPYLLKTTKGRNARLELIVQNYSESVIEVESALVVPTGWEYRPKTARFRVPSREVGKTDFTLRIPPDIHIPALRTPVVADVAINGQYRGQLAEAVVEIGSIYAS